MDWEGSKDMPPMATIESLPLNGGPVRFSPSPYPQLSWSFREPRQVLGWTIQGGGLRRLESLVWMQVKDTDLSIDTCIDHLISTRLPHQCKDNSAVFLTSADISRFQLVEEKQAGFSVATLATVGLGNALRAGDRVENVYDNFGTINLACSVSASLTTEAMLEALSIMTEAKTAALYDFQISSRVSALPATGTGTDCQAIVSQVDGKRESFCGKHTALGSSIGTATYKAVREGIQDWLAMRRSDHEPRV